MQSFLTFFAQSAGAPPGGGGLQLIIMLVLMFVMMYFLTIRPQRKRQAQLDAQIAAARPGDRIITTGGIHATLNSLKEKSAIIKIAEGVKIEVERSAIAIVLPSNREVEAPAEPVAS